MGPQVNRGAFKKAVEFFIFQRQLPCQFAVQSYRSRFKQGDWTMKRLFSMLKSNFVRLYRGFLRARLKAECHNFDEGVRRQVEYPSDDPRSGNGPPLIGMF